MAITVLVVDDEDMPRKLAALILQGKMGFNIIEAQDGREGFEVAKKQIPDLIISDDFMPFVSGLEMLKNLRNDPVTAHIPCILIYVNTVREKYRPDSDRIEDAVITSPYHPDKFVSAVKNVLEQRGLM